MGFVDRIAAAPITWGVDGSPGWGYLVSRDRYVREMTSLGLRATELGPDGFLPSDPGELQAYLQEEGLRVVGGWVPIAMAFQNLFDERLEYLRRACRQFQLAGADVLVLGPVWDYLDYEKKGVLTDEQWATFFANLRRVDEISAEYGLTTALHQHMGTVIEDADDLQRVLDNADVKLCVDTGHMLSAGIDPVSIVRGDPSRIAHVHLKDISVALAHQIVSGELRFDEAVKGGLFRPLGEGDVDLVGVIASLEISGYQGWYAIEQDCFLTEDPPQGGGPVQDCRVSYQYLLDLAGTQGW
jgi:inosose dehydratase